MPSSNLVEWTGVKRTTIKMWIDVVVSLVKDRYGVRDDKRGFMPTERSGKTSQ